MIKKVFLEIIVSGHILHLDKEGDMKKMMIGPATLVALALSRVFGALPEGYTQLTYLESTGTQYIDTGIVFGNTNGFSITYKATASVGNHNVCGSRVDTNDTRCLVGSNAGSWTGDRSKAYVGWNGLLLSSSISDEEWGTVSVNYLNSTKLYCRGAATAALGSLTQQTCSFYLFAGHYDINFFPTAEILYGYYRIFSFKMTANASVIMDLVPARRDADGKLGLYNLTDGVFFTNQGTGTFLPGEEVASLPTGRKAYTRLTYLESHGTEYIDTDVKFTDAHGYSLIYQSTTSMNNLQNVCGSRENGGDTRCVLGANFANAYVGWSELVIKQEQKIMDTTEGTTKVNYLDSRIADCRGTTSSLGTLATQNATFYLFAGHYAYQANVYGSYRIMAFTMTKDNEVVMDLIPVRRKADGALGMYDALNEAFYMNLGLGQFTPGAEVAEALPEGYAELAYVESTGTQYVNTGVKCTSNVNIQATIYNAYSVSKHLVGARTAFQQNALGLSFQTELGAEGYAAAWGTNIAYTVMGRSLTNAVGDAFHTFSFGGRTPVLVDSWLKSTIASQNFATGLDVYAFSVNNNGTPHSQSSSIRLSALKIYEGPTLVRDYVPMMTTNWVAGLYDRQNGVFYGNAGTGVFLAGPVVRGMTVTNAVANGSFETTAAGWTGDYTRVTGADTNVLHGAYIPDGTHAATLAAGSAITNAFMALAGRYRLAFQYMAARSGTGGKATVLLDGKTAETVTPTSIYGWVTANDDVKLSPGAHTLVFQNAGSGTICLDAVELGLIERIPSGTMVMAR